MPYAGSPRAGSPHPSRVLPGVLEDSADDDRAPVPPGPGPLRPDALPAVRQPWPGAARDLAGPVAQLRRRHAGRDPAGDPAPGVRPRGHALRPGQQLRPALRQRRDELRPHLRARTSRRSGTRSCSRPRPATTCGPGRTATAAPASTCWAASTSRWPGWASTTSTSSTPTGSTRTRRSRRPWGPSTPRCAPAGRRTPASRPTPRTGPARRPRSCATWALRCSSTSRRTRCSTGGSRTGEPSLLDVLGDEGIGCIAFSPLAQGMLTDRYLDGIPAGSRAAQGKSLDPALLTEQSLAHVRALNEMARGRGQSLAQLALAWLLRDERVTSVLVGASSVAQLDDSLAALDQPRLRRRRAGRDRPARRRRGHQHLVAVERVLSTRSSVSTAVLISPPYRSRIRSPRQESRPSRSPASSPRTLE